MTKECYGVGDYWALSVVNHFSNIWVQINLDGNSVCPKDRRLIAETVYKVCQYHIDWTPGPAAVIKANCAMHLLGGSPYD